MRRATLPALIALLLVVSVAPAHSGEYPPQAVRGVTVPVGFVARPFAQTVDGSLPTSLAWAEDAAARAGDARRHGVTLYVTTVSGNVFGGTGNGQVLAYTDEGGAGTVVASGLDQPVGIVVGHDGTLYVSENADGRGRVTALTDEDHDGTFETKRTVVANLPNGRHQTNGMAFGPDGMLYVANGNATDDGINCGPELYPGAGAPCAHPEMQPWSGSILRVDPAWTEVDLLADVRVDGDAQRAADGLDDDSVLVAWGFRNIYDVDFDPLDPSVVWTPMNGPDDPSGSDPLYAVDVDDEAAPGTPRIENAGFPSCLYDPHDNKFPQPQPLAGHEHEGELLPEHNPNPEVIERYGWCLRREVHLPKEIFEEGHEGTAGAAFTRPGNFPDRYAGDLFVAEWGSLWNLNGLEPTGHKLIHVDLSAEREVRAQREFMTGVLPIDVAFSPSGLMYVADMGGQIYEVQHVAEVIPDVVTVDMVDGQFVPQVVTIARGQTVRWVNTDDVAHNVRGVARVRVVDPQGDDFVLGPPQVINSAEEIPPGGEHTHTFDEDGETAVYHYQSTVTGTESTTMRGQVVVLPVER